MYSQVLQYFLLCFNKELTLDFFTKAVGMADGQWMSDRMRDKKFRDAREFMKYARDSTEIDLNFVELVFKVYGSALQKKPLSVS